jgi:hypothetical protein
MYGKRRVFAIVGDIRRAHQHMPPNDAFLEGRRHSENMIDVVGDFEKARGKSHNEGPKDFGMRKSDCEMEKRKLREAKKAIYISTSPKLVIVSRWRIAKE